MLFNSFDFVIFFIVVTACYYALPYRWRWVLLLAASCYFYMTFVPIYILIMFGTIAVDYVAGIWLEKLSDDEQKQRLLLVGTITLNVGVLIFFKYYNFFIENINYLGPKFPYLSIILPIGLSFHTFQTMAYLLEIYRGTVKAERHFGIFSLYVMFYPQLVAGPIERPQNVLPQFRIHHKFNLEHFWDGIRLMLWGFFKKVVIADRVLTYVNAVHDNHTTYSHWLNVLLAMFFFLIQVYCDFSGYSDIALGAAKTLGFDLMVNFNRPFHSKSVSEWWRRWHISLFSWFNDYLFSSLAGTLRRRGKFGIYFSVFITFAISGFWHGAAWTFVLFGIIQSIVIIFELSTRVKRMELLRRLPQRLSGIMSGLCVFCFFMFLLVLFRANTFHSAVVLFHNLFTFNTSTPFQTKVLSGRAEFGITSMAISCAMILLMLVVERFTGPLLKELNRKPRTDVLFCSLLIVLILFLGVFEQNSFIYFQF